MLKSLKGAQLLQGDRGMEGCDLDAPTRLIRRVSWLIVDHERLLAEVEINPVIAVARGAIAVYATIRRR